MVMRESDRAARVAGDPAALPARAWQEFLPRQRWYGDKERELTGARVRDHADLAGNTRWLLVDASFAGGPDSTYQLVGRAHGGSFDERLDALGDWLREGFGAAPEGGLRTRRGEIVFSPVAPLEGASIGEVLPGEMSNTLVRLGDRELVKIFRRVAPGVHPEVEALEWLARGECEHAPGLVGSVAHRDAGGDESALMLVAEHLGATRTLWSVFTDEPADTGAPRDSDRADDALAALARRLGAVTASLHRALEGCGGPPRPPGRVEADLSVLRHLPPAGEPLAARREELEAALAREIDPANLAIRTHGDLHLGQVVAVEKTDRLVVIDFEGEPALPLASRRRPAPAARDIACLFRSFSYARRCTAGGPRTRNWESRLREELLEGYWKEIEGTTFAPRDRRSFLDAVETFELQKAVAEIGYELSHRPDWVEVPIAGALEILDRA